MRAVVQRVNSASVGLPNGEVRKSGRGLLIYLGVGKEDSIEIAQKLVDKIINLRIFPNAEGRFDRSAVDERAEILLISQFTLYGDPASGRRPDFSKAAAPETARPLYEQFTDLLRAKNFTVKTGEFGTHMAVESINDGPVTLWLDTQQF